MGQQTSIIQKGVNPDIMIDVKGSGQFIELIQIIDGTLTTIHLDNDGIPMLIDRLNFIRRDYKKE